MLDLGNRPQTKYRPQQMLHLIILLQGGGLLFIDCQTITHRLFTVIIPLDEGSTAYITDTSALRRIVGYMITLAT